MTFAEFVLLIAVIAGLYFAMKPLQRWLERRLNRLFSSRRRGPMGTVIDVTDTLKKKKDKDTDESKF